MGGSIDASNPWLPRLRATVDAAVVAPMVGKNSSDVLLVARTLLAIADKDFTEAKQILSQECFPTFGRARDVLASLWKAAVEGQAAIEQRAPLSAEQAWRARKGSPVP